MRAAASGEDGEVATGLQGASYLHPEASKGTSETSLLEACWGSRQFQGSSGPWDCV